MFPPYQSGTDRYRHTLWSTSAPHHRNTPVNLKDFPSHCQSIWSSMSAQYIRYGIYTVKHILLSKWVFLTSGSGCRYEIKHPNRQAHEPHTFKQRLQAATGYAPIGGGTDPAYRIARQQFEATDRQTDEMSTDFGYNVDT